MGVDTELYLCCNHRMIVDAFKRALSNDNLEIDYETETSGNITINGEEGFNFLRHDELYEDQLPTEYKRFCHDGYLRFFERCRADNVALFIRIAEELGGFVLVRDDRHDIDNMICFPSPSGVINTEPLNDEEVKRRTANLPIVYPRS